MVTGAIMALKPMTYVMRIGLAILAFGAAMNADKVVARVFGLALLIVTGVGQLHVGIQSGTIVDILLASRRWLLPVTLGGILILN